MVEKAAEAKKKAPEAEAPVVEEEDLFEISPWKMVAILSCT